MTERSIAAERLAAAHGLDVDDIVTLAVEFAAARRDEFGRYLLHEQRVPAVPAKPKPVCHECGHER